ncbi:MAG: hypothetical protein LBC86_01755 [Oscillospiraceae bacterium]|jgi:hypothetical protein|nr:hypothetical protein [Oscillospiraceae bacterium]
MPRNNKTSNVLKLLNLKSLPENAGNAAGGVLPKKSGPHESGDSPGAVNPAFEPEVPEAPDPLPRKHRRKTIVKHMKIEKLSEPAEENPALKAIAAEAAEESEPKVFTRSATERQIVSVPLLLITEQLGTAVERFNACACDECLRGIINSAMDSMPPMYVRVVSDTDEAEVNRLIKERRPEIIRILAKICIAANKKPFHDE